MTIERRGPNRRASPDAVLDELMLGYKKPEDLLGDEGLFEELNRRLKEKALDAGLTDHLGYDRKALSE